METVTFPLPPNYFQPLQYSPEELTRWKRLAVGLVERTLKEEQPVFASQYEGVDAQQWKLIKTKDQLRVYQPRSGSAEAAIAKRPCVLAVGTIEGTLEDVIYGIHNTTTRDIRATRRFLSDKSLDSAVLHVFENGIDGDPFRSLALKWRAVETPAGSLVKNRDGCVLEYMGISYDQHGKRYAFQVSENVDHAICPPFTAQGIVRADVHIRAIYRELDASRVGVYFYGGYDMSGQIPKLLASWTAASVAFSVLKSVECAEAKKLTALALTDLNVTLRQKARRRQRRLSSLPMCSVCCTIPTFTSLLTSRSPLTACQICAAVMCGKCSSRKYLLSEHHKLRVNCCKQCIVAAKRFDVDARKPLQLVSLAAWVSWGDIVDDRRLSKDEPTALLEVIESPFQRTSKLSDLSILHSPGDPSIQWARRAAEPVHSIRHCYNDEAQVGHSPPELWMCMMELQSAAEQTYRITKEVTKLMAPDADWQQMSMRQKATFESPP